MIPIRLALDGNIEILIRATTEPFEPKARLLAQALARDFGLQGGADDAPPAARAGLSQPKLERVQSFIELHLARRLSVPELAAVVHTSPFHFTRLFKLATGLSPHAYLTRCRIERAKRMLAGTKLPLVDVAAGVGFQTQGHFTEVFHRHAGTTPRRFRVVAAGARGEATEEALAPGPGHVAASNLL